MSRKLPMFDVANAAEGRVQMDMISDDLKSRCRQEVDRLASELIDVSHRIHARPELAFNEHQAASLLASTARRHGLEVVQGAFGQATAFSAEFGVPTRPRIAILSEYDALPEVGHACGHNVIAAIGLGATLALHSLRENMPGSVRYLGTPAEERGCGKELMARAGAFDGVDAAMMLHPACVETKAVRTIPISEVHVTYKGRTGHPVLGTGTSAYAVDAAVIAHQAIIGLRETFERGEQIHGVIPSCGAVPNVFPAKTQAHYFVRAATVEQLRALREPIENCLRRAKSVAGCEVEINWSDADYLGMKVNLPLADAYERNARSLGRRFIDYRGLPAGGGDIGNVSVRVPTLHPLISCAPFGVMLHDPEFAKYAGSPDGDAAIIDGAKAIAMTALDFFCDATLRQQSRTAFDTEEPAA
jgi:amidohydrolase